MDQIRQFLISTGYELWDDNIIDGCNEYLRIMVFKKDDIYM